MAVAFKTGAVANAFLDLAAREGIPVTPMKLQKLLYFAHGWHLAITGRPLIDDQIEAWKFGPVVPSIYHDFKHLGSEAIGTLRCVEAVKNRLLPGYTFVTRRMQDEPRSPERDVAVQVIKRVWDTHKHLSGVQLSNITHMKGSPWTKAWEEMGPTKRLSKDIPDESIEAHFRSLSKR